MSGYSRIYRLCALFLAAILLLIVPSCAPGERIQTPLTPGEHVEYVRLSDGYLSFSENPPANRLVDFYVEGERGVLTYAQAVDALGFDLIEATAALPEHLQWREEDLATDVIFAAAGGVWPGYQFCRVRPSEERNVTMRPRLVLHYQTRDEYLDHTYGGMFKVFPWERRNAQSEAFRAKYTGEPAPTFERSRVGDIEVGILHENTPFAIAPEAPCEFYYAGFYIGDLAFALESHCNYCTQEEFIQVLLAIIDAAVAAENGTQTATQEG